MRVSLLVAVGVLFCSACRAREEIYQPGYIIGPTNDIERLAEADASALSIDHDILKMAISSSVLAVTVLETGKMKFCSGSLIHGKTSTDLPRIITNHHCFAHKIEGTNRALPNTIPEACVETTVHFDFATAIAGEETVTRKCQRGSLVTNYNADFAVFTLDQKLPTQYKPFEIWEGNIPADREAFIVHYPSAEESGEGKDAEQILSELGAYFPKKAITIKNCRVIGKFREEFWHLNPNLPFGLRHTCDLVQGSSGSGLVDAKTGKLLGINWGGITLKVNNEKREDNVASSAEYLRQFVSSGKVTAPPMPDQNKDIGGCAVMGDDGSPLTTLLLLLSPVIVLLPSRLRVLLSAKR